MLDLLFICDRSYAGERCAAQRSVMDTIVNEIPGTPTQARPPANFLLRFRKKQSLSQIAGPQHGEQSRADKSCLRGVEGPYRTVACPARTHANTAGLHRLGPRHNELPHIPGEFIEAAKAGCNGARRMGLSANVRSLYKGHAALEAPV